MSVLLGLAFACLGIAAIAVMAVSLSRCAPFIAELRSDLKQAPRGEELRLTLRNAVLPEVQPIPGPQRHRHHPKPIKRLLKGSEHSPALA